MKICAVIPHYDHVGQFAVMLPELVKQGLPIVIVDDASPETAFGQLKQLLASEAPGATLVRHSRNQGKGGAVTTGLRAAFDAGYTHALQIDADGQHDVSDIPRFVALAHEHAGSLICGQPVFDESISALRYYSRHITLYLSWLETLRTEIRDALCGFRLYPLAAVIPLIDGCTPGKRMAFDPEILVRCVWSGIPLRYLPIDVRYPPDGRSHFHYVRDNVVIAWMHTRLVAGMLWRLPSLLRRSRTAQRGHTAE